MGEGTQLSYLHRLDGCHHEGVKLAPMVLDRHVFAGRERVHPQSEACLVIFVRTGAIFECPPGVLRAARLVNEMPDGVILVLPEPANPAGLAVLRPKLDVDVSVLVEGCDEIVSMPRR